MNNTLMLKQLQQISKGLSQDLTHVIVGQLLSDAHAAKTLTGNTRLTWSFGASFKDYADWLSVLLSTYCNVGVYTVNVKATSKKTGVTTVHTNYRLKTATLQVFNEYFKMFYTFNVDTGKYIKIVPTNINDLMSPVTLAHLIMGDGNYHATHSRVRIYTNSFTYEDCVRLAGSITAMSIETNVLFDRVGKNGENQYFLSIGGAHLNTLQTVVSPHMHPSMLYRIGL